MVHGRTRTSPRRARQRCSSPPNWADLRTARTTLAPNSTCPSVGVAAAQGDPGAARDRLQRRGVRRRGADERPARRAGPGERLSQGRPPSRRSLVPRQLCSGSTRSSYSALRCTGNRRMSTPLARHCRRSPGSAIPCSAASVCWRTGHQRSAVARTIVEFRTVDQRLMDWYLASGEWRGRAGGYAIQGRGRRARGADRRRLSERRRASGDDFARDRARVVANRPVRR